MDYSFYECFEKVCAAHLYDGRSRLAKSVRATAAAMRFLGCVRAGADHHTAQDLQSAEG